MLNYGKPVIFHFLARLVLRSWPFRLRQHASRGVCRMEGEDGGKDSAVREVFRRIHESDAFTLEAARKAFAHIIERQEPFDHEIRQIISERLHDYLD
jgi:hypothetical protein